MPRDGQCTREMDKSNEALLAEGVSGLRVSFLLRCGGLHANIRAARNVHGTNNYESTNSVCREDIDDWCLQSRTFIITA